MDLRYEILPENSMLRYKRIWDMCLRYKIMVFWDMSVSEIWAPISTRLADRFWSLRIAQQPYCRLENSLIIRIPELNGDGERYTKLMHLNTTLLPIFYPPNWQTCLLVQSSGSFPNLVRLSGTTLSVAYSWRILRPSRLRFMLYERQAIRAMNEGVKLTYFWRLLNV